MCISTTLKSNVLVNTPLISIVVAEWLVVVRYSAGRRGFAWQYQLGTLAICRRGVKQVILRCAAFCGLNRSK